MTERGEPHEQQAVEGQEAVRTWGEYHVDDRAFIVNNVLVTSYAGVQIAKALVEARGNVVKIDDLRKLTVDGHLMSKQHLRNRITELRIDCLMNIQGIRGYGYRLLPFEVMPV